MAFSKEPIPDERSKRSIALYGADTPFRHWAVIQKYVQSLVDRNGYQDLISYNTAVENVTAEIPGPKGIGAQSD